MSREIASDAEPIPNETPMLRPGSPTFLEEEASFSLTSNRLRDIATFDA
jgi:hypothetical protein